MVSAAYSSGSRRIAESLLCPEVWEHSLGDKPPPASSSTDFSAVSAPSVSATATAIRSVITSNSNTGIKAAAAFSSRIASRSAAARKGKGKFAAKAAEKVDKMVFDYLDYLDDATVEGLALTAATDKMYLARVVRLRGGHYIDVLTQDNVPETARIPGHLRAMGSVSHKRHMAHVFGVGDVVMVVHGDITGKFDSPALLALLADRFEKVSYTVPAGFFSATKDSTAHAAETAAGPVEGWEFDYSEETSKLRKKRTLHRGGGSAAAGDAEEEVDIDAI
jgi:translation initiation factor IF-1